jgi:methyltransferase-like protein
MSLRAKQSRKSLSKKKLHEIATSLSLLAMTEGINGYFLKSVLAGGLA